MADPMMRKLARQLVSVDKRLHNLETVPQLAHSSIDDSALPIYDKDGNLVAKVGKQDDGTWGAPPLSGPTPPMPRGLQALGGPGTIHVTWTGEFSEGAACPLDFDVLEVLVDGALSGSISNRDGGSVSIASPSGQHYVSARIRTLVPRHSETTSPFAVEVGPPADQLFIDAKEEIDGAKQEIEGAKQDILDEREAREQALDQATQDIAEAQAIATEAKGFAERATIDAGEAHDAAVAAQQAAEQAAIEVAGKANLHYGPAAPPENQRDSTLWFDTSDSNIPKVWDGNGWAALDDPRVQAARQAAADAQDRADDAYALAGSKADQADIDASADQLRTEIAVSANGKNTITVSTAAPSAASPGKTVGDTWWRVDADGRIFGQWRWTGSAWTAVTIRSEVIANLDVGKLVVTGTAVVSAAVIEHLWAEGISAKVITTTRLTVAPGNLVPNGSFEGRDRTYWAGAGTVDPIDDLDGYSYALTHDGGTIRPYTGPTIPVKAGERYVFECWIRADKPNSRMYIELRDQDNTLIGTNTKIVSGGTGNSATYMMSSYLVPTTWTKYQVEFTARTGTKEASFAAFYFNHTNGSERNARVWLTGFALRPQVGAVLIEDGTVGADKIIADEVAAEVSHLVKARVENLVVTDGATIDDAVILKLASEMITAGVLRTAETGQRVVIDQSGIVMYGVDPDGQEFELVRIGPDGDNLITAGDTTISPDGVQAPSGTFDEIAVGGDDLSTILDRFPRGVVARGTVLETTGRTVTNGEVELGELRVPVEPWRSYRLTIEPLSVYATANDYAQLRIHWTQGGAAGAPSPTLSSEVVRYITSRRSGASGRDEMIPLGGAFSIQSGSGNEELRFLFGLYTNGTASIFDSVNGGVFRAIVEDIGPSSSDIMTNRTGSDSNPTPPPPAKRTYTKTYSSTGYRVYDNNGNDTSSRDQDVVQGLYSGGPSRLLRRGGWTFPNMTNDLSGATVEKVEMYVYMNHSYYTAGATVNPSVWGGRMADNLSPFTSVYNWKRNTGKWITLPSNLYNGFKSGTYTGVGVKPTNSYAEQYARFNASGAKIRITYVK